MKDSKKKIIAAAISVFSERGFHQAGMDEIARVAGVAKGTLYYNFASKTQLFVEAVTVGIESLIEQVRGELASDLPFRDHFRQLLESNFELYLRHQDLAKILSNELTSGMEEEAREKVEQARRRYVSFVEEILRQGQERGYIKQVHPRWTAVALVSVLDGLCHHLLREDPQIERGEVVDCVFEVLSAGLLRSSAAHDGSSEDLLSLTVPAR